MSAGPAPPNPGAPKKPLRAPSASSGFGRRLALGGAAVALVYALLPARSPKPAGAPVDAFKTPGVKNIERAYTNGGATPTHTKAYGGTIQGKGTDGTPRESSGTNQAAGFDRPGFGSDQRPQQPTKAEALFSEIQYGSAKGK
ncbi:uncharacterized protein A1O9_01028 [Exophiala aquamarina CBS 119918]|uniref:Uncharacterized protein n=1 Tax=Exophiala aquamarina CBS 119918 TaxID=1182545 RepID=A0A072PTG6_9EURO|nr:uncharacterized protein A1O9_01028 [Exophiala aquamarina CBS 119918]KEF63052.1 hypothetical protein A1O9_01028 [Exophiala aquamarina CBS 119918]